MQRIVSVLVLCSAFLILIANIAQSCGDKFIVIGRGVGYGTIHAATHPASILIYATNPGSVKDLQKMLQMAGNKTTNVTDENQLFSDLNSGHYDVVLVNLSDAAVLESKIMATPSKPTVLPVVYQTKGATLDPSAAQYPCVLKYKDKNMNPITVVDKVMDDKIKGKPPECKWSK